MKSLSFISAISMKKMAFRALFSLLLLACLIVTDQPKPSYAMPYYLKKSVDNLSQCSNTYNYIHGLSDVNVLAGMPDHITNEVNGVVVLDLPGSFGATTTAVYPYAWSAGYASTSYPYSVKWIFTLFSLDHQGLWQDIIEFTCAGPNQLTNLKITDIDLTVSAPPNPCPVFWDGRLNNCDAGQTVAIYCLPDGSVKVLAIWNQKGYDAILASPAEIAQFPKNPDFNTLIKTGNGASLYRLHGGLLQVNRAEDKTGKMYQFAFPACPLPN